MDELAYELGIDPLELRLRNHADVDPESGKPWSSKSLKACYAQAADRFGWASRDPKVGSMRKGNLLVGMGMATATYPLELPPRHRPRDDRREGQGPRPDLYAGPGHRHLHDPHPDRRRRAGRRSEGRPRRHRGQHPPQCAPLRRLLERDERRLGGEARGGGAPRQARRRAEGLRRRREEERREDGLRRGDLRPCAGGEGLLVPRLRRAVLRGSTSIPICAASALPGGSARSVWARS